MKVLKRLFWKCYCIGPLSCSMNPLFHCGPPPLPQGVAWPYIGPLSICQTPVWVHFPRPYISPAPRPIAPGNSPPPLGKRREIQQIYTKQKKLPPSLLFKTVSTFYEFCRILFFTLMFNFPPDWSALGRHPVWVVSIYCIDKLMRTWSGSWHGVSKLWQTCLYRSGWRGERWSADFHMDAA